jgi:hypothetical protein
MKKWLASLLLVVSISSAMPITGGAFFATCTGADPCRACRNCNACKHCHKDGGTCGVCKKS